MCNGIDRYERIIGDQYGMHDYMSCIANLQLPRSIQVNLQLPRSIQVRSRKSRIVIVAIRSLFCLVQLTNQSLPTFYILSTYFHIDTLLAVSVNDDNTKYSQFAIKTAKLSRFIRPRGLGYLYFSNCNSDS
jgi:hypothetical protein